MKEKQKKQYMHFAINLRKAYTKWKKATGGNMDDLADAVGLQNRKSISNYLSAYQYPEEDTLQSLCEVLGTTPDALNGLNDDFETKYKYDEDTVIKVHNGFRVFNESIGLDDNFLKFVRSAFPDSSFPVYTPITHRLMEDHFIREEPCEAVKTDDCPHYQITTDKGITADLTYADFAFLKDVQDHVTSVIEYLYYKRQKEMNEVLDQVNADLIQVKPDGTTVVYGAGKEKLAKYDPYYEYMIGKASDIIKAAVTKEGK